MVNKHKSSRKVIMKLQCTIASTIVAGLMLSTSLPLLGAESRGQLSESDYKFVSNAARGGMAEAQLGQLAKEKGASASVRDFGQRMVTDHSKANDELKSLVVNKGAALPTEMSRKENSEMERFQKLTGKDFDKEYAEHMVKDHKKDVKEFEEAAKDCKDPDLKAFAQKTLPTLQQHLSMAESMEATVKKE